jgi:S-adenosyl-L-methionine hydrolase (adenosine-forming)
VRQPIVFVTDYGRDDAYAAALVGAAWRVDPHAVCLEGTHGVPPGDVLAGAYHLKSLALAFADGAVFCAVVDPEVGTERRAIVIEVGRVRCVAPDNGLVSYLWDEAAAPLRRGFRLDIPLDASPTFHGRDVFAPAAAELASGTRLEASGDPIDDPVVLADAFAERLGTGLRGRVAVIDHFGNAITTIRGADIGASSIRSVSWSGGAVAGLVTTYGDIDRGPAALIGSAGHLEIAGRGRPVADLGGPHLGDAVVVELG